MKLGPWMQRLARLSPLLGLVFNRAAHPGLHCGVMVELPVSGAFCFEVGVRVGALTRIYLGEKGAVRLGRNVNLGRDVHFQTDVGRIEIGRGTSIQDHCRLYGNVTVGSGCLFAPNVYVSSGAHVFSHRPELPIALQERLCLAPDAPVSIGDDCWVGVNAVIMPGVTVGKGCIIGAGAVVAHDVPPYAIVVGVPAKVLRQRLQFTPPSVVDGACDEDWPYFYAGFSSDEVGRKDRHGFGCDKKFSLALFKPGAKKIVLSLKTLGGAAELRFGSQVATVGATKSEVAFVLETRPLENKLWSFEVSEPCRLLRATLV